jgi:hypothetical protein
MKPVLQHYPKLKIMASKCTVIVAKHKSKSVATFIANLKELGYG